MRKSKGISATITLVLMVIIIFSIAVMFWAYMSGYIDTLSGCIDIVDIKGNAIFLRNCGNDDIGEFTLLINEVEVPVLESDKSILQGQTKKFTASFLPRSGVQIVRVVTSVGVGSSGWDFPKAWLVEADIGSIIINKKPKLLINGSVFLNDKSRSPYSNRILEFTVDNIGKENVRTDLKGKFSVTRDWNFSALFPNQWWIISKRFSKGIDSIIIEPPGKVDFDGNDFRTQKPVLYLEDRDQVIGYKEITPSSISKDSITLDFNYTLRTGSIRSAGNEKAYYSMSLSNTRDPAVFLYPLRYKINCFLKKCITGNTTLKVQSDLDGRGFIDNGGLKKDNNGPYIDFSVNVSHLDNQLSRQFVTSDVPSFAKIKVEVYKGSGKARKVLTLFPRDIRLVSKNENQTYKLNISLSAFRDEMEKRYNDSNIEGHYTAFISAYAPDSESMIYSLQIVNFSINDTATAYCMDNDIRGQFLKGCLASQPLRTVMWELPSIGSNQQHKFGFSLMSRRDLLGRDIILLGSSEHIFFVNGSGNVKHAVLAGSGMTNNDSITGISTSVILPKFPPDKPFSAYTYGIPRNVGKDVTVDIRTVLMNVGSGKLIERATVFNIRGDIKRCSTEFNSQGILKCNLADNVGTNETVENYAWLKVYGYNVTMNYSMANKGLGSTCNLPKAYPECNKSVSCSGDLCSFEKCASGAFCNVTDSVTGTLSAMINVSSILKQTMAYPAIHLWNWYLNKVPLWKNKGEHFVNFFTVEHGPYIPANMTFRFLT